MWTNFFRAFFITMTMIKISAAYTTNHTQFPPNSRPMPTQGLDIKTGDVDSMVNTENKNEANSKVVVNLVLPNHYHANYRPNWGTSMASSFPNYHVHTQNPYTNIHNPFSNYHGSNNFNNMQVPPNNAYNGVQAHNPMQTSSNYHGMPTNYNTPRPERPEESMRPERLPRPSRPERPLMPERVERPLRPSRPERVERPPMPMRPERPQNYHPNSYNSKKPIGSNNFNNVQVNNAYNGMQAQAHTRPYNAMQAPSNNHGIHINHNTPRPERPEKSPRSRN